MYIMQKIILRGCQMHVSQNIYSFALISISLKYQAVSTFALGNVLIISVCSAAQH